MSKLFNLLLSSYKNIDSSIWILMSAIFADALGHMVKIFMPLYLHDLNYSLQLITILITIYGTGGIIGAYLGGYLSDKIGPVKILIISLVSNSILLLIFPFISKSNILFTVIFLLGISQHIFRPASIYILSHNLTSGHLTRLIGLRRVMVNLGICVAGALGGYLANINYQYIFFCDALISLITAFSLFTVRTILLAHLSSEPEPENITNCPQPSIYTTKFFFYIFILFINSCVFFQLNSSFPLYLKIFCHINLTQYSLIYAFSCFLIILLEIPILNYIKDFNPFILTGIGSLLCGISLSLLPIKHDYHFLYFIVSTWTVGEILFFPIMLNLILSLSYKQKGRIIGIQQSVYMLGQLSAPLIGGILLNIGEGKFLWYGCGIIGIISCAALFYFNQVSEQKSKLIN